jgi:diaminopimelate epimerase
MFDFHKYHALGNDYLVIDPRRVPDVSWRHAAPLLCDRNRGVGADGVLIGPVGGISDGEPVRLLIFNSDGTVCGRSGNGIRIFGLYLAEYFGMTSGCEVRTDAGLSTVDVRDVATGTVQVTMGAASFDPARVPVTGVEGPALDWSLDLDDGPVTVSSLNNGNPHTVVLVDAPSRELAHRLGPVIAGHRRFPERTNVQFVRVLDRGVIEIEVWERAAGYTLASGAGACAAATVARTAGLVDDRVTVRMPGGELEVGFDARGEVLLTGVVEKVASGVLSARLRAHLGAGSVIDEPEWVNA